MKKALILGFGVSGKAAAALLHQQGVETVLLDKNPGKHGPGVLFDAPDFPLDEIAQVVLSPGVSPEHSIVRRAVERGIEVVGETELAFRYVNNRCIGVTGTNGKTTVTLLLEHVLRSVGLKARAVGNVGTALSEYLLAPDPEEILIVELSSFQLETLEQKKLDVSVYLNLTPDHLDRYATLYDYARAKARIEKCSKHLLVSKQVAEEYGDLFHRFEIFEYEEPVAAASWIERIKSGAPEKQNVQAAEAICRYLGIGKEEFLKALASFKKSHHRIEWIGEVGRVHYINDSKATNIDGVLHAIKLFEAPVVLIAGGVDKGASYQPWIKPFQGIVKKIVAYGEAASKLESELAAYFPFEKVHLFQDAFKIASIEAKAGECVLLSPGCSSFDQFKNYEHRGDEFRNLVQCLLLTREFIR